MKTIGLTGSIGMGKSTTAQIFADAGIPVFDSDACVHDLYARNGAGVAPVEAAFPGVISEGAIDRARLSEKLAADPQGFERLEKIVHPLVTAAREAFAQKARKAGHDLVLFDIPLLFETGAQDLVDILVVVSAPDDVRRERVMQRPGMTAAKLDAIIARQTPDSIKRARADYIVETHAGIENARQQVAEILIRIRGEDEGSGGGR